MEDILPISVLAFLRMEQQGLQPKCKFVHQSVPETARKKLITEVGELQSLLNNKTQEACRIEKVSHRNFASIIDFDINRDVEYIPSLSEGSGAMAPVDPNYSQGVNTLKKRIIDENSSLTKFSIDGFGEYLLEFWGAVKKDPFAYGFKDIIETQAAKVLRDANEYVTWVFKQDIMSHFISNALTSIGNCQSIAILDQTFEKLKQELKEVIVASYAKQESKLNSFFENPTKSYEKYITDRRHQTFEELENLSKELGRDANKKIKEFYEIQKTKINSIHIAVSFKDKIYQKIKDFVDSKKQNKKGDLSWTEAEQKNLFEEIWTSIIKETNSSFEVLREANVVSDARNILYEDIYSNNKILKSLVPSSTDLIRYNSPFDVQKSIDAYLSKQNFVGQFWGRLTELKEEEKKTIQCFLDELDKDIDIILETKKQSRDPYNKNDLTSILKSVQTKFEEKNKNLKKTKNFDIHIGIEVAFAVSVCGRAIKKLEIIDENFRNVHNV